MAESMLKSSELKVFFENIALMLTVGVQTDEAVHILADNSEEGKLEEVCREVYSIIINGVHLSTAMKQLGCFPQYAVDMVEAGESTGHLEDTLASLANYYDEEDRLFKKISASIAYPAIILCIMSVVLAFTVGAILPVFLDVYENLAGGLAASSFSLVDVGIVVGWIALVLTLVFTVIALIAYVRARTAAGREKITGFLSKLPGAKAPFYELALARFTSTLAVYTASGANSDVAMQMSLESIEHPRLRERVQQAYDAMIEPVRARSLVQAVGDFEVFDPVHLRMLTFGMRSGKLDEVLLELSDDLFESAIDSFDALINRIEPMLAAFVTVAVGLTLISVMLPLIGIMGSIG